MGDLVGGRIGNVRLTQDVINFQGEKKTFQVEISNNIWVELYVNPLEDQNRGKTQLFKTTNI